MAIAFYCEDEDPKLLQGYYYDAFGYSGYQQQQLEQQQSSDTVMDPNSQTQAQLPADASSGVDENNNSTGNCALHGNNGTSGSVQSAGDSSDDVSARQLMHILHQVLYRYTMEGALSPAHTACASCNKIYYLFQLLY